MLLSSLVVDPSELAAGTGWEVKPEGACLGDVCVPLPAEARRDGAIAVDVLAARLGMPLLEEPAHGLWALGPAAAPSGHALVSAVAPEVVLPDVRTGEPFALSSMRGRRTIMVAWASW